MKYFNENIQSLLNELNVDKEMGMKFNILGARISIHGNSNK